MNPLSEHLNDKLECQHSHSWSYEEPVDWLQSDSSASEEDAEVESLVALARRLQAAPPLQVDPIFAQHLEKQVLLHNAALHRRRSTSARGWLSARPLKIHPVFGKAFCCCLLVLLLGTSLLAVAQASAPGTPLYGFKRWEQHVQVSLFGSPYDRAEQQLQSAQDQLSSLAALPTIASTEAYLHALTGLEQQISDAVLTINALPPGSDRDRLSSELATLETQARHTLREMLPRLAVPERLLTTNILSRLGDVVPRLKSVELTSLRHPNGQIIISLTGEDLQPAAHLLLNGQPVEANGLLQNGVFVFKVNWVGNQLPQGVGILNPDGTAAQTTAIQQQILASNGSSRGTNPNNGSGHGNGSSSGSGHTNGSGHGNNGNSSGSGHGRSRPGSIPILQDKLGKPKDGRK